MPASTSPVVATLIILAILIVFAPFIWHLMSMQPVSTKTVIKTSTITETTTIATPSPITVERTSFVTLTKPMLVTVTTPMPITITRSVFKTLPTTITRTVTTTVLRTLTQRIEKTITSPVLLTTTRTITATTTSPIILTSTSYVWATITATKIIEKIQTKTLTKTITTTITTTRVEPNFRLSNWEELHNTLMSNKVKEVYVLILYYGGFVALDNNFVNLINDLKQLAEKNITIKVLVHPRACIGWQFPPPGAVSPDLVKLINELNKTLGCNGLRIIQDEDVKGDCFGYSPDLGFNPLTIYSDDVEAEVLIVLNDGTAKLFLLADPYNPKIILFDHVEKLGSILSDMMKDFNHVFNRGLVWNPEKACHP